MSHNQATQGVIQEVTARIQQNGQDTAFVEEMRSLSSSPSQLRNWFSASLQVSGPASSLMVAGLDQVDWNAVARHIQAQMGFDTGSQASPTIFIQT